MLLVTQTRVSLFVAILLFCFMSRLRISKEKSKQKKGTFIVHSMESSFLPPTIPHFKKRKTPSPNDFTHTPQIHKQTQPTHTMFTQVAVLLVALCTVAHGETWDLSTACKESVVRYAAKQTNLATTMLVLLDTCSPTSSEYNADTCAVDVPQSLLLSLECEAEAITALVECKEAVVTVQRQSDVQQDGVPVPELDVEHTTDGQLPSDKYAMDGGVPVTQLDGNGLMNLAELTNEFNSVVDQKEAAIHELRATGDFEDTKTVLLMQQMMNEWSFTVGLSSSLTKTIADVLKGIVQKI